MSKHSPADYLAYVDQVWTGRANLGPQVFGDFADLGLVELGPRTAFFPRFANVAAFDTGEGLVLVDTGEFRTAEELVGAVRAWRPDSDVRQVVYTHGHVDHVFGAFHLDADAAARGAERPEVLAHEAVAARFDLYTETAGYNAWINRRQFQAPDIEWPTRYRYPDTTYRTRHSLRSGGLDFELVHAKGETDDATYVWVPELRTLCTGDLFIWNAPNAGNPQKVQRFPVEWARALREMQALGAELLLPGHGVPIVGAERVASALGDTAELLESLCSQTLALMNAGARLDEVLQQVVVPAELLERPFLHPAYDEPEFVIRNVWRLYGGWYDQNPAHLKPAAEAALAAEFARAAGGAQALADRALALLAEGELRLACHLAETAALAAPEDRAIAGTRAEVYTRRAEQESSTMARGVFGWAAAESRVQASGRTIHEALALTGDGRRAASGVIAVGHLAGDDTRRDPEGGAA